eukprot:jgi/Chrzof1/1590/Cz10g13180.t1
MLIASLCCWLEQQPSQLVLTAVCAVCICSRVSQEVVDLTTPVKQPKRTKLEDVSVVYNDRPMAEHEWDDLISGESFNLQSVLCIALHSK